MTRLHLAFILLLVTLLPAAAQTPTTPPTPRNTPVRASCQVDLPCGIVPWELPQMPNLVSPSPYPTVLIRPTATVTPSQTSTATTATPVVVTATPTSAPTGLDLTQVGGGLATAQGVLDATPFILEINGTPVVIQGAYYDVTVNASTFFSYVRGLAGLDLGVLQPIVSWLLFLSVLTIVVKFSNIILPIATLIFGAVRKIIQIVVDFIPG
jgi:hypothetical protein